MFKETNKAKSRTYLIYAIFVVMNKLHQLYQQVLLQHNEFSITGISNIQEIGTYEYREENYNKALMLLEEGNLGFLKELTPATSLTGEDITVIQFNDQHNKHFLALIYDSGEPYQYPEVLQIYRL